jgi:hypothetical protein
MFEKGKYRARIEDYGVFQATFGQQHPTAFVRFTLTGYYDPSTGDLTTCAPASREYTKAITENTIQWLLSDLKSIGFDRDGLRFFDPESPGAADLFGREIDVVCDHEEYQGKGQERWSVYREPRRKRVDAGVLAALDARYRDEVKKVFGPQKPAPTVPPVPAPPDDPF